MENPTFSPRPYQRKILDLSLSLINEGKNPIIELDCGMGKRLLTMWLGEKLAQTHKVIVLLNSSASLFETKRFMEAALSPKIKLRTITSQIPSVMRWKLLNDGEIVLSLPQTLANTLKKHGGLLPSGSRWAVIINEVDQIIRRTSYRIALKQPFQLFLSLLEGETIIGMSGTLRDEHYVMDERQLQIRRDLETLKGVIPRSSVIYMDEVWDEAKDFITVTNVEVVPVEDTWTRNVSDLLELHISELKDKAKQLGIPLRGWRVAASGYLSEDEEQERILQNLSRAYLIRKYLFAMPARKVISYLYSLLPKDEVQTAWQDLPPFRRKTQMIYSLLEKTRFGVVLCSYLSMQSEIALFLKSKGLEVLTVSGRTRNRASIIEKAKNSSNQRVLIMSNVGERDIDLPEADVLIIYDIVNTPKVVYQKLKRSRGGNAFVLSYKDTQEENKVKNVLNKIGLRYSWSLSFSQKD